MVNQISGLHCYAEKHRAQGATAYIKTKLVRVAELGCSGGKAVLGCARCRARSQRDEAFLEHLLVTEPQIGDVG